MLADLVREFCKENKYDVYENYQKRLKMVIGDEVFSDETVTTIGIVVKPDHNFFEVMAQLTSFLEAKEFDEQTLGQLTDELEEANADYLDPDMIINFPCIQDYQPLQS